MPTDYRQGTTYTRNKPSRKNPPIAEKAKSKAQQKFMGMVHSTQKGESPASPAVAKAAKSIKPDDAEDFASTKHKGLPGHVPQEEGAKMARLRELVRYQVEQHVFERRFMEGLKSGYREMSEAGPEAGSGTGFKNLVRSLAAQEGVEMCRHDFKEMAEAKVRDPKALAAFIGRKKFGKKKFQDLAARGQKN